MNTLDIYEKDFFHNATIKICSSLDIIKAMRETLLYLQASIPADGMGMVVYHPDEDMVETVAGVFLPDTEVLGVKINISPAYKQKLDQVYRRPYQAPQVRMVDRMGDDELSSPVASKVEQTDSSCLQLRLKDADDDTKRRLETHGDLISAALA